MRVNDVMRAFKQIAAAKGDPPQAAALEKQLHAAVLVAISERKDLGGDLAAAALATKEIDFPRD